MNNRYGEWLRMRREEMGLTQQELADLALMSRTPIAHIEAGRRIPTPEDAARLDKALGTDVMSHFRPARYAKGRLTYFDAAAELEREARSIRDLAPTFVPGLLQTEAYARAGIRSVYPPPTADELEAAVAARMARAEILRNPEKPVYWALLDEAVLHRHPGDPDDMVRQLHHIIDLAESSRIRVHILPFDRGLYGVLQSVLKLMTFDDQPPVAYSDALAIGGLHDDPQTISELRGLFDLALSDALSLKSSIAELHAAAKQVKQAR